MTDRSLDAASQHRRAWEVIPWVVNGSASAEQRSLLDAHLKGCEDCRQELMRQREWQAAMASAASPAVGDVESGLQRLLARIDGASGSGQAAAAGAASPQRRRAAPSSLTQWLAAAVVVEALALAALSIGLVMRPDPAAGYETLSQTAPTPRGATIRIVPAPSLRLDDLQRLLDKLKLQIVAGPNSAGAYDLAPRAEQPARELQLSTLRADAGLRFVEPIESRRIAAMKSMQPLLAAITVVLCLAGCANVPAVEPRAEWRAMRERPERLIVVAVANPKASASIVAGSTTAGYASLQPYLASAHARQVIDALKRSHRLTEVAAWPIQALRVHCAVLEVPAGVSRDELVRTLSHDARIEIVQPLQDFEALGASSAIYNDPYASLQHGLAEVEAVSAHAGSRGRGVSVAVIDTGADAAHPDLQGRIASLRNLVDRDAAQLGRDRHGTEVAGVIAAVANNRLGIVGIAPEATLRIYKACWQRESGGARCNSFTLALALAASLEDDAQVINLSLGGPRDELLARLVRHAIVQGRIVVGAVPKDGSLDGFPIGVAGVIAVDATDRPRRSGVLNAPGRDILTLAPGGRYDFNSGSSLAAAHVSGVIALLLAAPEAPRPAAVQALLESSRPRADGSSSVSACVALAALRSVPDCSAAAAR